MTPAVARNARNGGRFRPRTGVYARARIVGLSEGPIDDPVIGGNVQRYASSRSRRRTSDPGVALAEA